MNLCVASTKKGINAADCGCRSCVDFLSFLHDVALREYEEDMRVQELELEREEHKLFGED